MEIIRIIGETETGSAGAHPVRDSRLGFRWKVDWVTAHVGRHLRIMHFPEIASMPQKNSSSLTGNSAYENLAFVQFPLNQHSYDNRISQRTMRLVPAEKSLSV